MKTVIIGAGPAGVTVAQTLRQYNYHGEILLVSSEPFPPYAPPAMIEYFMTGNESHLWKWKDIPERLGLDYMPDTIVEEIMPESHEIRLADGTKFNYDRLVIATGSHLFAPLSGADKSGIYNFKSLLAAAEMVKEIREGYAHDAVIIGAGFIGVEISILLGNLGLQVSLLEMNNRIMPRRLDAEVAEITLKLIEEYNINVRLETKVKGFLGDSRAESLELESGEILKADLLIAATGVRPNIDILKGSGVQTNWGVPVDEYLHTNIPDIYAVGDVAETPNRLTGERYVHAIFPNAIAQGRLAAYNMLGWNIPYEGAENMNSLKHLGIPVIAAGKMEGEELRVRRGNILRKLYLLDSRIVGFQLIGDIKAAGIYRMLMNKKVDIKHIKDILLDQRFSIGHILDQNIYSSVRPYPIL
jgi:NADPH-dependent 2,4-dienoyl-CoA reductase/sulfur reductase-like enzyme